MKKLLVSMVCLIAIVTAYAQDYYWYENEKISIEEVGTQFYIAFEDENIDKVLEQNKNLVIYKGDLGLKGINYISSSEEELGKIHWAIVEKELKDAIVDQYDILYCTSNYTSENTYKESACISNIFYVKLKQQEDYSFLEEKAKELNVTIVGEDKTFPLLYILLCNKTTEGNALTCANAFYETGKYAYTEVNWMMSLRPADDVESSISACQKDEFDVKIQEMSIVIKPLVDISKSCLFCLYDIKGTLLYSTHLDNGVLSYNISHLQNGVYFYKLSTINTQKSGKIIK
ncbi:MAG: T9SS type A sorting domain-containing protein [Bacteroidales bacterium]|nr:T9SS type A sorting domain-containing protein [Bacteroidales bacterium]